MSSNFSSDSQSVDDSDGGIKHSKALKALDRRDYWNSMLTTHFGGGALTRSFLPSYNEIMTDLLFDVINLEAEFELYDMKLQGLLNITKCSQCNGPFRSAVVTPCGHVFCGNCLKDSLRAGIRQKIRKLLVSKAPELANLLACLHPVLSNEEFVQVALNVKSRVAPLGDLKLGHHACPLCRSAIRSPPSRLFGLDHISDKINDIPLYGHNAINFDGLFGL
ncbi:hypothetical protein BDN72DRAFT_906763 [Pluteus cervinus]|uniref:Uncharacterized protein n=1 Tax=Pluteus cervinus TaxID=181527 RepID=A0ACD2ZYE4_9AGAR|nr:hypothetical protein BDN72DRAFT_906763 [Pluteus cervinus]